MLTFTLLTTRQLADVRGVSRQHIARLVRDGKLKPYATLANGAHLFTEDQAEASKNE